MSKYVYERQDGENWVALPARLSADGIVDDFNDKDEGYIYLVNTAANRVIADTETVVRVKFDGSVIFTGVLVPIDYAYSTIKCRLDNQAIYTAKANEPFTQDYSFGEQADTILAAVCANAGLTAGECPLDEIGVRFVLTDNWDAIKYLAKVTGKSIITSGLTVGLGTKGTARSYTGPLLDGSHRKTDKTLKYTKVKVEGKDVNGNLIYGEAGIGPKTKIIRNSNASDVATLNLLAATELAKVNVESKSVPLKLRIAECAAWVSGDTLPINISYLAMNGTYTIMRIMKGRVYGIVEVEAALPKTSDILKEALGLQELGILPPIPLTASDTIRHYNASAKSTVEYAASVKLKEIRIGEKFTGSIRVMFSAVTDVEPYGTCPVEIRKNDVVIYSDVYSYTDFPNPKSYYFDVSTLIENDTLSVWGQSVEIPTPTALSVSDMDIGYDPAASIYFINQDPGDFVGETGDTQVQIYKRAASQPATPTGDSPSGWYSAPPSGTDPLWMSTGLKTFTGHLVGVWSDPVQITGPTGDPGSAGDSVYVQFSADGSTWHDPPFVQETDVYAHLKVGVAGDWTAAIKLVGDDGADGAQGPQGEQGLPGVMVTYSGLDADKSEQTPTPEGATYYATDTNKWYVAYGEQWLFAGSGTLDKLTGTLAAGQVAANSITSDMIAANVAILDKIWAGTITGKTLQTATTGARTVISSGGIICYDDNFQYYDSETATLRGKIYATTIGPGGVAGLHFAAANIICGGTLMPDDTGFPGSIDNGKSTSPWGVIYASGLNINGTIIDSSKVLQNVTANASIINAGVFDEDLIPWTSAGQIAMAETLTDKISLYGNRLNDATNYGFGVANGELKIESNGTIGFYSGGTQIAVLDASGNLQIDGKLTQSGCLPPKISIRKVLAYLESVQPKKEGRQTQTEVDALERVVLNQVKQIAALTSELRCLKRLVQRRGRIKKARKTVTLVEI